MKDPVRQIIYVTLPIIVALILGAFWLLYSTSAREELDRNLYYACQTGNVNEIKILLQQGANPNTTIEAYSSHRNFFARLQQFDYDQAKENVPLACGARSQHAYEVIKLLLEHGANLKQFPGEDSTVLFECAQAGNADAVKLVLKQEADVNGKG